MTQKMKTYAEYEEQLRHPERKKMTEAEFKDLYYTKRKIVGRAARNIWSGLREAYRRSKPVRKALENVSKGAYEHPMQGISSSRLKKNLEEDRK